MPVTMVIDPSKTHTPKRTELASPIVKPVQLARKNKLKDLANRYNDDNDGIDDLFNVPAPVEKEEKMDLDDNNNDKEVVERPPEPTKRKFLLLTRLLLVLKKKEVFMTAILILNQLIKACNL